MSELFLIAHKVRGEAAFDVATKMDCPHCVTGIDQVIWGCFDCEEMGYWWIIPTSGHRAFPYWFKQIPIEVLPALGIAFRWIETDKDFPVILNPPEDWPDHFKSLPAPKIDITSLFKASREVKPHIARRL